MANLLIVYATRDGHTAKIARYLAESLGKLDHSVRVADLDADTVPERLDDYDGIVVGSSVHCARHEAAAVRFATARRDALRSRPSAFFSVSLSAAGTGNTEKADVVRLLEQFAARTHWQPALAGGIAGAVQYTRYNPVVRILLKRIVRKYRPSDVDTTRDYVYTDWDGVARFAEAFDALLNERDASRPRTSADGAHGARASES